MSIARGWQGIYVRWLTIDTALKLMPKIRSKSHPVTIKDFMVPVYFRQLLNRHTANKVFNKKNPDGKKSMTGMIGMAMICFNNLIWGYENHSTFFKIVKSLSVF